MAGRGRRLESIDFTKKFGSLVPLDDSSVDLPTLTKKIHEINVASVDSTLLLTIESIFTQLCSSKEILKDALSNLHCEALCDIDFGDKLLLALEKILNFEVDGTSVRGELLLAIQSDFEERLSMSKLNHKKFLNALMLLGSAYKRVKVCGVPIQILGQALLEYFDLIMKSKEPDDFKVLVKQILINGQQLSKTNDLSQNYEFLKCSLRNTLIDQNLNNSCKCWILLCLDFLSNNLKPLTGVIRDFYVTTLGEEYSKLESLIEIYKEEMQSSTPPSKKERSSPGNSKTFNQKPKNINPNKSDLVGRFSDLNVTKPDSDNFKGKKGKGQTSPNPKNTRRENQKWQDDRPNWGRSDNYSCEHDDRFNKDEDFYGVQLPRRPKTEHQKNYNSDKFGKNIFEKDSETDPSVADTKESPEQASKLENQFLD